MEDSKLRTQILIDRYLDGTATEDERHQLERFYMKAAFKKEYADIEDQSAEDINRMGSDSWLQLISGIRKNKPTRFIPWLRIAVAASIVITLSAGLLFYISHPLVVSRNAETGNQTDIVSGTNKAFLTFADGKTIALSDAKTGVVIGDESLKYNDGSLVQNSSGAHFSGAQKGAQKNTGPIGALSLGASEKITVTTPRGGTYQVRLPDGTKVWLNAASSLTYSTDMTANTGKKMRNVVLDGEAYFEVYHDENRPFTVKSAGQEITVLGTHFNVNSYSNEGSTKTTLLEGSVSVNHAIVLKPDQQSVVSGTKQITVRNVDVSEIVAWKDGDFKFNNVPLEEIMRQLERWYDIEVVYQGAVGKETFNGVISRKANLSRILKILEKGGVGFKIEGKKLTVTP